MPQHSATVLEVRPSEAVFGKGSVILDHRSINRSAADDGTGRGKSKAGKDLVTSTRHPEWRAMQEDWTKWRLTYEGGSDFQDTFLEEYSRRENEDDWAVRKKLTYNPNHAGALIDGLRNALMVKMPEVTRTGSTEYEELVANNVDMQNTGMSTFIGLEVVPLLLAQGKRFVGVDAPRILNRAGRTRADDGEGRPYLWAIDAEEVLSWSLDGKGEFVSILLHETVDERDPHTGLVSGTREQFRLMIRLGPDVVLNQFPVVVGDDRVLVDLPVGERGGVLVKVMDKEDADLEPPILLDIPRIPIVEFRLVESLMRDIADMQIALLNLASTDMSFVFRGNFPIYTEQYDASKASLKPMGSRRKVQSFAEEISDRDRVVQEDERPRVREPGNQRGIGYSQEVERPDFIAPPVANLKASMEKQKSIAEEMRVLLNRSLISLNVRAVEQSGKSKEADRVDEEAALATIAGELETGEATISDLIHEFQGTPDQERSVRYPVGYSLKTAAERREEAKELAGLQGAVRSKTFSREIQKRTAEVLLKQSVGEAVLQTIRAEVDEAPQFDSDVARADIIQKDVQAGLVSRTTGSVLRGHEQGEADQAQIEQEVALERLSGSNLPSDVDE